MRTQHTPGPWKCDKEWLGPNTYGDGNSIPIFPANGGVSICDVTAVNGEGLSRPDIQERAEANARLIASAPELLQALQHMLELCQQSAQDKVRIEGNEWPIEQARAAIAKAIGE